MADTKITALSALTAADPANDVLPIVDVNDPFMAASGTTKKISINNILGASGTATLASATITGDLTVDTSTLKVDSANNRVGVNTASPATDLEVRANGNAEGTIRLYSAIDGSNASPKGSYFSFRSGTTGGGTETARLSSLNRFVNVSGGDFSISTADTSNVLQNRLTIDSGGVFTFAVGGSTAMTLNANGLGIGVTPTSTHNLSSAGPIGISGTNSGTRTSYISNSAACAIYYTDGGGSGYFVDFGNLIIQPRTSAARSVVIATSAAAGTPVERLIVDPNGNVGIGVTPSAVWTANGNLQVGVHAALYTNASLGATDFAYNSIRTGSDTYQYSFATSLAASRLQQRDGSFRFFTAPAGTSPNAIAFTERLRLKETGQLRFVPLAADPAGAEAGDVYYNSSSNKLKCYNGTTWNDLF